MGGVVLGLRLALAAVFVVSGGAKAANRAGTGQAATALGVPRRLAGAAAVVLPVFELAVAALLVPASTARLAAALGGAALVGFTGLLAVNLARGRRPDCHCFGALSTKPISGWSVVRNVGLLAAAGAVAASDGGRSLGEYTAAQLVVGAALAVLIGVVGAQTWALFHLLRQHGRLLLRVEQLEQRPAGAPGAGAHDHQGHQHQHPQPDGLPAGSAAPEFSLQGLHGETMTLAALRAAGKPVLLVFSDPACGPCTTLAPDLARWQQEQADRLRVVLMSSGPVDKNRAKAAEHGLVDVLLDPQREVAEAYRYNGTPGAVLIDIRGQVASPVVSGGPAITALVERVTKGVPVQLGAGPSAPAPAQPAQPAPPPGLPVGAQAPEFRLPTVGGGEAALSEFRGRDVVVLFWNPRCGFCQRMLPDLLAWEQEGGPPGRPELLVVTTGDEAANAAQGFASTVLLDAAGSVMSSYGADGTPMAVRIDGAGRVTRPLGIGAPGVIALLNGERVEKTA